MGVQMWEWNIKGEVEMDSATAFQNHSETYPFLIAEKKTILLESETNSLRFCKPVNFFNADAPNKFHIYCIMNT